MGVGKCFLSLSHQHHLGLGSLFSQSPGFCHGLLAAHFYNEIFSRMVVAAAVHPESQGAFDIGCPGRRRERNQAFRAPPLPYSASSKPQQSAGPG